MYQYIISAGKGIFHSGAHIITCSVHPRIHCLEGIQYDVV